MDDFREYDVVRVKKLNQPNRQYNGTASVRRPPRIGDDGTIVYIPQEMQGLNSWCIVQCLDNDGLTIWVADFTTDELELVEAIK